MKKMLIIISFFLLTVISFAQNVTVKADLLSKYVWRGLELGDVITLQPAASLDFEGFEFKVLGSSSLVQGSNVDEVDLILTYTSTIGLYIGAMDYYFYQFPDGSTNYSFSNYNNYDDPVSGNHLIEAFAGFKSKTFPIDALMAINVYNDKGNTAYFELGYNFEELLKDGSVRLFIGATPGSEYSPRFYSFNTEKFNVVNLGVTFTKDLSKLPMNVSWVLNPRIEAQYLVFGVTF